MFDRYADSFRARAPIASWRRRLADGRERDRRHPRRGGRTPAGRLVGSYPSFHPYGPRVEVVLKSADAAALAEAVAWVRAGARGGRG